MNPASGLGPLADGARVVIIGGGPGGVATALALHRLARQADRRLHITIIEGKRFDGETHYNQCAGVLSPPLPELLERDLEVPFPWHLVRAEVHGYVLHTARRSIVLDGDHEPPSYALRRVHFDAYMLQQAAARGIHILHARATDIEFHADHVRVYTENDSLSADVVVGAFGMDEGTAALFQRATDYHPPKALSSVVTKYHPGPEGMVAFGTRIHAFLLPLPGIEFGAVTPKGNHLTINIAGQQVTDTLMEAFLRHPKVRAVLPNLDQAGTYDPRDLRFFKGRFPRTIARGYYGDRFVLIGDAAGLVRAFKGKGVTSAVLTGIRAAQIMLQHGISHAAFHAHYRRANHDIRSDQPYGQLVRHLVILTAHWGGMDPVLQAAQRDPDLRRALFDAVSAHRYYREVLARMLRPRPMRHLMGAYLTALLSLFSP